MYFVNQVTFKFAIQGFDVDRKISEGLEYKFTVT